jgi:hypothetical protein
MVQAHDKFTPLGSPGNPWLERRLQAPLGLLTRILLMEVAQEFAAAHIPHQGGLPDATDHPPVGCEQRHQALRAMLMPLSTGVFLLGMIDLLLEVSLHRPRAAGRVRLEPTARVHGEVRGLLHRLHRAISGRVEDDCPRALAPGNNRGPIFLGMAPTRVTLLAAPTRSASQGLFSAVFRVPLVASGVVEVIRFHRTIELARHCIRQRGVAQPPAPARARADRDAPRSGETPRRARETPQKRRQSPGRERPLALGQQGVGAVSEGALAAVVPGAFAPGSVVVLAQCRRDSRDFQPYGVVNMLTMPYRPIAALLAVAQHDTVQVEEVGAKLGHRMFQDPVGIAVHGTGVVQRDDPGVAEHFVLDLCQ